MARVDSKVNFQLSVTPEEKAMIKADAKAMGLPVARYVVLVCKLVNESTREMATEQFVQGFTKAVMRGYNEAIKSESVPK